jgi:prophage regulatory protein
MFEDFGKQLDPLLREAEVEVITSLSKTTRWRKIKAGEFPAPVKISARRCAWRKAILHPGLPARLQRLPLEGVRLRTTKRRPKGRRCFCHEPASQAGR